LPKGTVPAYFLSWRSWGTASRERSAARPSSYKR